MDSTGWDIDRELRQAWLDFESALADAMGNLGETECLKLDLPHELAAFEVGGSASGTDGNGENAHGPGVPDGPVGLVAVRRDGREIVVEVTANKERAAHQQVSPVRLRRLRRLGLNRASAQDAHYGARFDEDDAYVGAEVAVHVLREVFGVLHPEFLVSDELSALSEWRATPAPAERTTQIGSIDVPGLWGTDLPAVIQPIDRDHLERLVEQVLTPFCGGPPEHDDDGDIGMQDGSAVIFVRVDPERLIVRVFSPMAIGITRLDRAADEVADLNRLMDGVKFELRCDQVVAEVVVPACPFVPRHLHDATLLLAQVAGRNDRLLAERTGGRTFAIDPECDPDELPPAPFGSAHVYSRAGDEADHDADHDPDGAGELLVDGPDGSDGSWEEYGECGEGEPAIHPVMDALLQLDAGRPGSLTPDDVARICGGDRDLLLELIRWNAEQELAWRRSRDAASVRADADEVRVCEIERSHTETTITLLRETLRLVLLG